MSVVKVYSDPITGKTGYTALSADALPDAVQGSLAYITDENVIKERQGGGWVVTSRGGAVNNKPSMAGSLFASGTLADGTEVDVPMLGAPLPCTVVISPTPGGSDVIRYWYTVNGIDYVLRAGVSTYTEEVIDSPIIGLRFQRYSGAGTASTYGVA